MLFAALVSTVSVYFGAVYGQRCGQKTLSQKRLHERNMWSNQERTFLRCVLSWL